MPTWIDRYKKGDCAAVWAEMEALGAEVRKPKHRKAALSVVIETMSRCRQNVQALFEALPQIGYRFRGAPEAETPDYPLELRISGALSYVKQTGGRKYRDNPWSHPAFAWLEEEEIDLPAHHRNGQPGRANYRPPGPRTAAALDDLETLLGRPLPLAVRCWFETVGSVDLAGTHPILNRSGDIPVLRVVIEPDAAELTSDAGAGAAFVERVRAAFAFGGFPGWEGVKDRPEREIQWLRTKMIEL